MSGICPAFVREMSGFALTKKMRRARWQTPIFLDVILSGGLFLSLLCLALAPPGVLLGCPGEIRGGHGNLSVP